MEKGTETAKIVFFFYQNEVFIPYGCISFSNFDFSF